MVIFYVGSSGSSSSGGVNSVTVDYSSTAGNTLIICGNPEYGNSAGIGLPASITDSAGNTWAFSTVPNQMPPAQTTASGAMTSGSFIGWCTGAKAISSVTVTSQDSASLCVLNYNISEWAGIGGVAIAAGNNYTTTMSSNQAMLPPPVIVDNPGSMVLATYDDTALAASAAPAGTTQIPSGDNMAGWYASVYAFPGGPGVYQMQPWPTGESNEFNTCIAVFYPYSPPVPGIDLAYSGTGAISTSWTTQQLAGGKVGYG